ncbi:MAG: PfkB family carbohydrate kinase [Actinomycetales bacterium]
MIIGLGAIAVDTVLVTAGHWSEGKGRILQRQVRMGGNVRNAVVAAAALGAKVAYLGCLSAADEWSLVTTDLADHGVDLEFVERHHGADPIQSTIVLTADAERFIAFDDSVLQTTPMPSAELVQRALAVASVLLVDASTAPEGTLAVIEQARGRGIPIVVDAERFLPGETVVEQILAHADHIILPRHFALSLTATSLDTDRLPVRVRDALSVSHHAVVAVTDGANGVVACSQVNETPVIEQCSAFEVRAVDTVGCGDVFHGAYAVALDRGLPLGHRLRYASAAAASVAALTEDRDRIPDVRVIAELLGSADYQHYEGWSIGSGGAST